MSPQGDALLQNKLREKSKEPEGMSPTSSHHSLYQRSASAHMSSGWPLLTGLGAVVKFYFFYMMTSPSL